MIEYKRKLNADYSLEEEKKKCKGYRFGSFNWNNDFVENDIWCSFDKDFYNFHIVPDMDVKIRNEEDTIYKMLIEKRGDIIKALGNHLNGLQTIYREDKKADCAKNHIWISDKEGEFEYLLILGRLWHEGNYVNNSFGKIQFMRYPIADKQINLVNGKFQMMYPASNEDGGYNFDKNSGHLTYNPVGLTLMSDASAIANQFTDFIKFSAIFN